MIKIMYLYSVDRQPIGTITYDGVKFNIVVDKYRPSLCDELKRLIGDARQNGVIKRYASQLLQNNGDRLITESMQIVSIEDESFFSLLKDTINRTQTFHDGRVFAVISRVEEGGGDHVA